MLTTKSKKLFIMQNHGSGLFTLSQQGRHRSTIMGAKTSTSGIGMFVACDLSTVTYALLPAVYLIIHWDGDCHWVVS